MSLPSPKPGDARIAELTRAFLAAEYRWQLAGEWHDITVGLPTPGLELAYPDATSFGLLSAWNPASIECSREANLQQDEALQQALADSGHAYSPAFSAARNRTWREPGWLVRGMAPDAFDALARRFGQLGTLWWRPGRPVHLRMDARRPAALDPDPNVDWLE